MNTVDTPQTEDQSPSQDDARPPVYLYQDGIRLGIIAVTVVILLCMMAAFWGQLHMLRNPQPAPIATEDSAQDDEYGTPLDGELEDYLQSRPDVPLPVDENAKEGLMSGIYESPSPWLHDGYAQGMSEWKVAGSYMGVSADKSVIVFDESAGSSTGQYLVGRDMRTGEVRWHVNYEGRSGECSPSINGVVHCAQPTGENYFKVFAIDYNSGKLNPLGEISVLYGATPDFVAAQSGQTVWRVDSEEVDGGDISDLVAIKAGKIQWRTPIVERSACQAADGVIVCESRGDENRLSLEVFSTVSGKKVSQFKDLAVYQVFRDGVAIQTQEGGNHKYSWAGEKIGDLPFELERLNVWPLRGDWRLQARRVFPPLSSVDHLQEVRAVNAGGEPLMRKEKVASSGEMQLVDISTGNAIGGKGDVLEITVNESGSLYLLEEDKGDATVVYSEEGKEIFRITHSENGQVYYPDGIIYSIADGEDGRDDITVYVPKGK